MTSRRQLYALGEPFGDSCTRREAGRVIYGGGGGGSSSSSSNATTTTNTDKRQVVDNGAVGVSSDSSTVNVSMLDNGAVNAALDLTKAAGAKAADSYALLLQTTVQLASQAEKTLQSNVDLAGQLAGTTQAAYKDAAGQAQGNKNLVYAGMAVVGLAAVTFLKKH